MEWLEELEKGMFFMDSDVEYKGKPNLIADKSFDFALSIMAFCKELNSLKEFEISRQIFRSGTSIGANVSEATAAQTKKDFIAKMAIASKEARETQYWLKLILKNESIPVQVNPLLQNCNELVRILTAIVKTAQFNSKTN